MKRHTLSNKQITQDLETVLATFRALSEQPRIRLILALREEQSVNDLVDALELRGVFAKARSRGSHRRHERPLDGQGRIERAT